MGETEERRTRRRKVEVGRRETTFPASGIGEVDQGAPDKVR